MCFFRSVLPEFLRTFLHLLWLIFFVESLKRVDSHLIRESVVSQAAYLLIVHTQEIFLAMSPQHADRKLHIFIITVTVVVIIIMMKKSSNWLRKEDRCQKPDNAAHTINPTCVRHKWRDSYGDTSSSMTPHLSSRYHFQCLWQVCWLTAKCHITPSNYQRCLHFKAT